MKKIILILMLTCGAMALSKQSQAQTLGSDYKTSFGFKGYFGDGSIGGLNIKHFIRSDRALEGGIYFKNHFVMLEGMYEWHGDIQGAPGLKWYTGPGVNLGFVTEGDNDVLLNLKGTIGIDYKFNGAPIDVALDLNPTFTLTPDTDFNFFAGVAFRFAF